MLARILGYEIARERGAAALEAAHLELQASERRRIQLVGEVAHELRAPLMVIDGYMEGIIDGVVPAAGERLQLVRGEAQRVRRLVDDLEQLVRLGDVRADPFQPEPVDVALVAADAVARFAPLALASGGDPAGLGRERRAGGGRRARPARPGAGQPGAQRARRRRRAARWRWSRAAGPAGARLAVRDTGVGMPQDEAERAFDRFFRGSAGRDRYDGSGLGLAIVR